MSTRLALSPLTAHSAPAPSSASDALMRTTSCAYRTPPALHPAQTRSQNHGPTPPSSRPTPTPRPMGGSAPAWLKALNYNTLMHYLRRRAAGRVWGALRFVGVSVQRRGSGSRMEATTTTTDVGVMKRASFSTALSLPYILSSSPLPQ